MIQTEIKKLEDVLGEAIQMAKLNQSPQLLSYTNKIESIEPILYFNQAKLIADERMFWSSTEDAFFLVGAGEVSCLHGNSDRFSSIEKKWKEMLTNALTINPYQKPGTGPIAFGGFSFDPNKEKTSLWLDFKDSQFRVPAFLLTVVEGCSYLTINVVVQAEDHPKQLTFNIQEKINLLLESSTSTLPEASRINSETEINPSGWKQLVKKATDTIREDEADKIVLARELKVTFDKVVDPSPVLDKLLKTQTNSFIFAFESGQSCFLGATPERLVRVQEQQLLSTCLAGTARRGETEKEDKQISKSLMEDIKNRQEHQFVVQMIKDAVSVCCEDIYVPEEPSIYALKNLQHLYTPVQARLKKEFSIIDVIGRLHPTPALGGLPRQKSLAFIRENEQLDRGWYGAPIGWVDAYDNGEFAVAIRSALLKGKEGSLFAGCGVVRDSDPEAEYQETTIKFTPMLSVLGGKS